MISKQRNNFFDKFVKISDLFKVFTGKKDVNQAKSIGKYRFYSCSPDFLYSDEFICDKESILIAGNGSYTGRVSLAKPPFDLYQRTYALTPINNNEFLPYAFAILKSIFKNKVDTSLHGSAIPYIVLKDITDFEIPIDSNNIKSDLILCKSIVSTIKNNEEEIFTLKKTLTFILNKMSKQ